MKTEQKPEMTQEEFIERYAPRTQGILNRGLINPYGRDRICADLQSVIRGETFELLKQRDDFAAWCIENIECKPIKYRDRNGKIFLNITEIYRHWIEITKAEEI